MKYYKKITEELGKRKSLKDILSLTGVQLALRPLQILKSFVVAKYLGPETYGILKSVELIGMLNKFGSLGFRPTVIRNASTAIAQGDMEEVVSVKNNAYTGEFLLSLLLFSAGCVSSLFFESTVVSIAIILASIGLFTAKTLGMIQTELQLYKRFRKLSKIILYQGLFNSILVIATVPLFNIYAVLSVPIVSAVVVTIIGLRFTGRFFKPRIDKVGFLKVLKVSIPLTIGTLSYGLFRYTERILIVKYLGLTALGFFGFADTIVSLFITFMLGSVLKVRGLTIFEELGKKNFKLVHKILIKETRFLVLLALGIIVCLAIGMSLLIPILLPKWNDAILITIIFSFILPLKLLSSYIAYVIKSPTINNLKFEPVMWVIATGLMIGGFFTLKDLGMLTLINFILVDLVAYALIHFSYIIYYYKMFYLKYIV
jgi:O-antigen/teichoic acid export membrane protein